MPAGRPTKYKPEYCDLVVKHLEEGLSIESFAGVIDVDTAQIYRWKEKYPEFRSSINRGVAKSLLWWDRQGQKGLWGTRDKQFNHRTWEFNMRNKFGWRDEPKDEELSQPVSVSYKVKDE